MTKKLLFLLILLLIISNTLISQITGIPKINNYSEDLYKAGTTNWTMAQGSDGRMYFGNAYGVLEFDGIYWALVVQAVNKTIIRSLAVDNNDRIYIGSNQEIGYSDRNSLNQRNYVTLNHKISHDINTFYGVWNIIIHDGIVIFQSNEAILFYDGDTITGYNAPEKFLTLTKIHNKVFAIDSKEGIYTIEENKLVLFKTFSSPIQPIFMLPYGNKKYLIGTENNGIYILDEDRIYKWENTINNYLEKYNLYCGKSLNENKYAIGTDDGGLIIFNSEGDLIHHIDMDKGLISNSITSIYQDIYSNLWLTLYNGLAYIELGSSFTYLGKELGLYGAVHSTAIFKQKLYIATNQGIYYTNTQRDKHSLNPYQLYLLPNSTNSTWKLDNINNELYMSRHTGFYKLKNNNLKTIYKNSDGAWDQVLVPGKEDYMIQGTYRGFLLYKKRNNEWVSQSYIKGYNSFARQFEFDADGNLWLVNGLQGIFKFKLNEQCDSFVHVNFYDEKNGLPSHLFNNLCVVNDQIFFGTQQGVYRYEKEKDSIVPDIFFNQIFEEKTLIRELKNISNNKIIYVKGFDNQDEIGEIIINENGKININKSPFQVLKGKIQPSFEEINIVNENQILFGTKYGLAIYNKNDRNYKETFNTNISRVTCPKANDSLIYSMVNADIQTISEVTTIQELPYKQNALRISYSAAFFEWNEELKYQTYLEGFDEEWSTWNEYNEREFTNLPEGKYTFRARAKNAYGVVGNEATFKFNILPPWYRTKWMYILYTLILISILFAFIKYKNYQIAKEKERIRIEKEKELKKKQEENRQDKLKAQKKIMKLENDRLTKETEYQTKELALSAMHLTQMNEAISGIKNQIEEVFENAKEENKEKLDKIRLFIEETLYNEEYWKNFEFHFNKVHHEFLNRLKKAYPKLTSRDLRLCAYLRMNISSKEIAPLMGVTYRAVEQLRYRIRKKLELPGDNSLTEFIINY